MSGARNMERGHAEYDERRHSHQYKKRTGLSSLAMTRR